ncbi:MAG TPA: amidohydrolase family protein, partial [Rhodothermia bacterium]
MKYDTVIQGGVVVTPGGRVRADVGIHGEKIAAVGTNLTRDANVGRIIDAKGHYVLPGMLDVHVHLALPFCGTVSSDDYYSGTRAAARGGVTTLIDFAIPYEGDSLTKAANNWFEKAEDKALIDYTFHICITRWDEHQGEIGSLVDSGFTTFKEFMIYAAEGWQSDDRA